MRSHSIEAFKKRLKISTFQRQLLVGLLLGDGHLETQNHGRTYRLKIEHSLTQKLYVDWLYEHWKAWTLTPPQRKEQLVQGKTYMKYWFNTVSHASLRFYGQQFYRERCKIVPKAISHWLTPLALAIWFMDDGSRKSHQTCSLLLNTQCFEEGEVMRLVQALKQRFDLDTRMRRQKEGFQIFIPSSEARRFVEIIQPYLHTSMRYKVPMVELTQMPKE